MSVKNAEVELNGVNYLTLFETSLNDGQNRGSCPNCAGRLFEPNNNLIRTNPLVERGSELWNQIERIVREQRRYRCSNCSGFFDHER